MIINLVNIRTVKTEGMGDLSFFEGMRDVPFEIKRIYVITNVKQGIQRGGHSHKNLKQLLFCPYGRILIKLDDGYEKREVILDSPEKGLVVENNTWREMLWLQDESVLCVAADSYYDPEDYIRDYDTFIWRVRRSERDSDEK